MEALDEDVQIVQSAEPVVLAEVTPDEIETTMETQSTPQEEANRSDSDETIDPSAVFDDPREDLSLKHNYNLTKLYSELTLSLTVMRMKAMRMMHSVTHKLH